MDIPNSIEAEATRMTLERNAGARKIALVFHLKIDDVDGYENWLEESRNQFGSNRLHRLKVDPAPREGMLIDEIVIDEHSSAQYALAFMSTFGDGLKRVCSVYAALAIVPEPNLTFRIVKAISRLIRLFKGVKDKGIPASDWRAENIAVWPDENQMSVARSKDLDEPLFVYNLNKYKPIADYNEAAKSSKKISGQQAYDRYTKIAGFELLRRGAYPVYGGKPICLMEISDDCMLFDRWDHFILVRYPQRRNLLAMIESDEFHNGQIHRDAGLERVAIFMANKA